MEDMLLYQNNPVGVELFSYVNTFVGFMLHILPTEIKPAKWNFIFHLWFIHLTVALEEGTQNVLRAKIQFSVRTKTRTYAVKTCLQDF